MAPPRTSHHAHPCPCPRTASPPARLPRCSRSPHRSWQRRVWERPFLSCSASERCPGWGHRPRGPRGAGTARVRFSCWVWGFCTSISAGRARLRRDGRGGGSPGARGSALGGRSATHGFVRAQEPGTPLRALPWAGTAEGCPGPAGRVSSSRSSACHTRTLPSAIARGSSALRR